MPSISITETMIMTTLRSVMQLYGMVNEANEPIPIIRGQVNRVPEPLCADFAVMWPISRNRLATNLVSSIDNKFIGSINNNLLSVTEIVIPPVVVGVNIYGANVEPNCVILSQRDGTAGEVGIYCVSPTRNTPTQTFYNGSYNVTQATEFVVQCDIHGPTSGDNAQKLTSLFRDWFSSHAFRQCGLQIYPLYCNEVARQIPYINGEDQLEERYSIDLHLQFNPVISVSQQFADELHVTLYPIPASSGIHLIQ